MADPGDVVAGGGHARALLVSAARPVATLALRSRIARSVVNRISEDGGALVNRGVIGLFGPARVTRPFVWRCRFLDAEFRVPVVPDPQRSWMAAWTWRWAGNAALRRFYELFLETVPRGTLLDVGAHDGLHTYPFAAHGYRCLCFEPQFTCGHFIRRTAALNGFDSVDVIAAAVGGEESATAAFYVAEDLMRSSMDCRSAGELGPVRRIDVPVTTLDAHCPPGGLAPDIVKIDVEGSELEVLRGARKLLARCLPTLVIEVSSDPAVKEPSWELLTGLGYRVWFLERSTARDAIRRIDTLPGFVDASSHRSNGNFAFVQAGPLAARLDALA